MGKYIEGKRGGVQRMYLVIKNGDLDTILTDKIKAFQKASEISAEIIITALIEETFVKSDMTLDDIDKLWELADAKKSSRDDLN